MVAPALLQQAVSRIRFNRRPKRVPEALEAVRPALEPTVAAAAVARARFLSAIRPPR